MKNIVILISGRGSNMQAILEARLPLTVAAVISNEPQAAGLAIARARGVATRSVDHRAYAGRAAFDAALAREIDALKPDLVVLAGFMRILTDDFVGRYSGRLLNIHPSLLPAFTGLHTHRRALEAGVKIHGCSVHFVTPHLDHGPIVIQAAVPVLPDDSEDTLAARVLAQEHRIYPQAIRWFCDGRLEITPRATVALKAARDASGPPASSKQGSRLRDANVRESGAAPSSAGVASVSGVTSPKGARRRAEEGPLWGSDPEGARRAGVDAPMASSTVASAQVGPLLHVPPAPVPPSDGALLSPAPDS